MGVCKPLIAKNITTLAGFGMVDVEQEARGNTPDLFLISNVVS